MKNIKVGIGRIYNATACEVEDGNDVSLKFEFRKLKVYATLGKKFRHVILTSTFGPPRPSNPNAEVNETRVKPKVFPSSDVFPADWYFEIEVFDFLPVSDATAKAFNSDDLKARDEIFAKIKTKKVEYDSALNFIAGYLGLKLHSLLVKTLIVEQTYIYHDDPKVESLFQNMSITVTDSFVLNTNGKWLDKLRKKFPQNIGVEDLESMSITLQWLLRAWSAEDNILKYLALFTALERVIPALDDKKKVAWEKNRESIVTILKTDKVANKNLLEFLKTLVPPKHSLFERFESWATKHQLEGWQADISAFKKFSIKRNLLLHQGKADIEFKGAVKANELKRIEDITERYVSLALFKDADVYKRIQF